MARRILSSALLLPALLGAQEPEVRTTARDRRALAVTVYADGRALVQDTRRVTLPRGTFSLAFADVSAHLRPATAQFAVRNSAQVTALERNFEFDLITPERLLEKSLGAPVRVRLFEDEPLRDGVLRGVPHDEFLAPPPTPAETARSPRLPGQGASRRARPLMRLLAADPGAVVEVPGGYLAATPENVFPRTSPEGLRACPTLLQRLRMLDAGMREVDLTYLTSGLTWKATYRVNLSRDARTLDLAAFVTLRNETGTEFPDAKLQLVAGEVNQAFEEPESTGDRDYTECVVECVAAASPSFQEEKLSEFLLFSLSRTTTLGAGQEKQILLLEAREVPVEILRTSAVDLYALDRGHSPQTVESYLTGRIENLRGGPLGRPLPRGEVLLSQGDQILATTSSSWANGAWDGLPCGPISIDNTPVGERVELSLGRDPDLQVEARLVSRTGCAPGELSAGSDGPIRSASSGSAPVAGSSQEESGGNDAPQPSERLEIEIEIQNLHTTALRPELQLFHEPGWRIQESSEPTERRDAFALILRPTLAPLEARTIHLTILKP